MGHGTHALAKELPLLGLYLPASQGVHLAEVLMGLYVPAAQAVQPAPFLSKE